MAGRAKVGGDVTPVRFADGVLARIDAVAGKGRRAEFIRDAVDRALTGGAVVPSVPADGKPLVIGVDFGVPPDVSVTIPGPVAAMLAASAGLDAAKPQAIEARRQIAMTEAERRAANERSDKMKLLLEAVRRRAMTARDASLELGWPEILTAKVADKLFAAGLVHFPRGAGVMEAK